MLTAEDKDILQRVNQYVPQFAKLLERKLQEELSGLPSVSADKVQLYQGRARMLQEFLAELKAFDGTANRIAKP